MAVRDVLLIGILIFALGTGFFVIHFTMNSVVDKMTTITEINSSNSTLTVINSIPTTLDRLDYIIFGLFIGLCLALIISGWFIGGHPIFMFIYFIVLLVGVVLSTVIANFWETFSGTAIFGATVDSFPITNNLLLYLPYYIAVIGFIGLIVMFAKPYFMGGEYGG